VDILDAGDHVADLAGAQAGALLALGREDTHAVDLVLLSRGLGDDAVAA
jgi:hypothetical protein